MPILHKKGFHINPARTMIIGFLAIILAGTVLMCMPFASKSGEMTPFIDSLFTATSSTCVTGLTVFDTNSHWTLFGQIVMLIMIEVGGVGFLTFVTFFNVIIGKKMNLRQINKAAGEYSDETFVSIKSMFKNIIKYVVSFQASGALILMTVFIPKFGLKGIYNSIFISISAFCNAGMDIFGSNGLSVSLSGFNGNAIVLLTTSLLTIAGGFGYIVWDNIYNYRTTKRLHLHTKVVLIFSGALLAIGTVIIFICEFNNAETIGNMSLPEKTLASFFTSTVSRTSGFSVFNANEMYSITKLFVIVLMFIGAAPGSTGGGIKVTTLAVLLMTVVSVLKNRTNTQIMGRVVNVHIVFKAFTVLLLSVALVMVGFSVLYFTSGGENDITGMNALFETMSAFSTVGSSVGVSETANIPSKIVLIIIMIAGRIGPVSLVMSLTIKGETRKNTVLPEGRIMVG